MAQSADFFVSYTSADRAWAEWIAWQLEDEGYQVVVQAWDFSAGRDWAHEMQQATATAERVVAVVSAAYLGSAHGEAEWRPFYAEDPSGEHGLLLPVRVDKVDPRGLLKTRVYVDLVDKDSGSARTALLAAARGTRGKPTTEPGFPGAPGHPGGIGAEAPRFPGEPENQIPDLVGVHQWVWPREHGSAQGRHAFHSSAGTVNWPTLPPLDMAQAALIGWARAQRLISPSVFEGQLTVRDANVAYLRVAAAFDERRETWVEEYPGPLPGQPETYDGSLKHARLSIDYGDRRWQNISDWHGVRRGVRKQDCFSCADGWVKCQACNGSGKIVVQPTGACPYCSGQGFPVTEAVTPRGEVVYRPYRCPNCEGTGMAGPVRWPCQNGCSEGWFVCPRCQGHSYYLPSFYWGQLSRHMVQFGIWIPDNRDLRRFTKQYKLVRQTIGWPDLSDLPQDVQRAMNRRLEERLIRIRNQTLGQSSVVYHLETQLFLLPAVQVPYDHESKRAYLIGRHWEVYAPDEGRPGVRVTRAWVSARKALHAWLDRSSSSAQRPWPILAVILGIIVTFVVVLFMMKLIIGR